MRAATICSPGRAIPAAASRGHAPPGQATRAVSDMSSVGRRAVAGGGWLRDRRCIGPQFVQEQLQGAVVGQGREVPPDLVPARVQEPHPRGCSGGQCPEPAVRAATCFQQAPRRKEPPRSSGVDEFPESRRIVGVNSPNAPVRSCWTLRQITLKPPPGGCPGPASRAVPSP